MTTPTPQVDIPQGTLITLAPQDWKYGDGTLWLRVSRVMREISRYEPGWVWVEGTRHDNERGQHWIQALVRVEAVQRYST